MFLYFYLQEIPHITRTQEKARYQDNRVEGDDSIVKKELEIVAKDMTRFVQERQH